MKRLINLMLVCMTLVVFASCERVAPNYAGVLMGHSCISPWQYNPVIQRLWTL